MIVPFGVTELLSSMAVALDVKIAVHSLTIDGEEERVTTARSSVFNSFLCFILIFPSPNSRFKKFRFCDKPAGFVVKIFIFPLLVKLIDRCGL